MLKIFNSLTRKKEEFKPITTGNIKIYICGVTVYDLCHLGHARTFVIFDNIIRYLSYCGYQVYYVRNITDIDDKIIKRAYENNETIKQLTNRMIKEMHLDLDSLNIIRPNDEPKATEHIDVIIELICILIEKKHAYMSPNGDIMFSVETMQNYGILSNRKKTSKIQNNALKKSNTKKNPMDFVIWKKSKPGEPYWPSPWGTGRPGWHIECSAMNHSIFGNQLDIHGGGSDLVFPHHDNEIAQFVCAYNAPCANIWMHSGLLLLNYKKMSKSANNFLTIRELLKNYDPETIRYFLMSAHYRSQLKYNNDNLKNAQNSLKRLYIALRDTNPTIVPKGGKHFISKFVSKMNDDFNTPEAYSVLFEIAHQLNHLKNKRHALTNGMAATLKYLGNIIGLLYQKPETFLKKITSENNKNYYVEKIQKLILLREEARKNNKWELADRIRLKLSIMGVIVEDHSTGITKWHYNNNDISE